jgi:hypothetical protein
LRKSTVMESVNPCSHAGCVASYVIFSLSLTIFCSFLLHVLFIIITINAPKRNVFLILFFSVKVLKHQYDKSCFALGLIFLNSPLFFINESLGSQPKHKMLFFLLFPVGNQCHSAEVDAEMKLWIFNDFFPSIPHII